VKIESEAVEEEQETSNCLDHEIIGVVGALLKYFNL